MLAPGITGNLPKFSRCSWKYWKSHEILLMLLEKLIISSVIIARQRRFLVTIITEHGRQCIHNCLRNPADRDNWRMTKWCSNCFVTGPAVTVLPTRCCANVVLAMALHLPFCDEPVLHQNGRLLLCCECCSHCRVQLCDCVIIHFVE